MIWTKKKLTLTDLVLSKFPLTLSARQLTPNVIVMFTFFNEELLRFPLNRIVFPEKACQTRRWLSR